MPPELLTAVSTLFCLADLTSVFNWNTKQLFCFIVAEYESKSNVRHLAILLQCIQYLKVPLLLVQTLNQVVMWDKVVASPAEVRSLLDFLVPP